MTPCIKAIDAQEILDSRGNPTLRVNVRLDNGIGTDKFLVMYSGSMGLKQGLHTLVDAARERPSGQ